MDDDYSNLSCLKEALDIASICGSGAVFEISDAGSVIEEFDPVNVAYDRELLHQFASDLYLEPDADQTDSFENIARHFRGITDDNLVMKQIVKHGSGPIIPPSSSATIHYNAYLEYADEPFDSSRVRKSAFKFNLGSMSTIRGFEIAVSTMRKKEMSKFLICPEYAFGEMGCPPRIPRNATCLYVIEMIDFKEIHEDSKSFFNLSQEERGNTSLDVVLKAFKGIRNRARQKFHDGEIRSAYKLYSEALVIFQQYSIKNESEERQLKPELIKLHTNLALCCLKLMMSHRVLIHCNEVILLDNKNLKAFYFKGKALGQLGDFQRAIVNLKKADAIKPGKSEIVEELEKMEKYSDTFSDLYRPSKDVNNGEHVTVSGSEMISSKLDEFLHHDDLVELQPPYSQERMEQLEKLANEKNVSLTIDKDVSTEDSA